MKNRGKEPPPEGAGMELLGEALALLLPEGDARMAAWQLKKRLGSLENVFQAPEKELAAIPGMNGKSARYLRLTLELVRAYMKDAAGDTRDVLDLTALVGLLRPEFVGRDAERVAVALLDGAGRQLYTGTIFEGGVGEVTVNFRRLVGLCANYNASGLALAHNHPTGMAWPSMEDILITGRVMLALISVGIELTDHIIFAGQNVFSFVHSGLLPAMEEITVKEQREQLEETQRVAMRFLKEEEAPWGRR